MTPEQILEDIRSDRIKKVIIDSDTYNEIDDQYAIAYAATSPKLDVLAVNAAPFHNWRSSSFEDGMEKSYAEICRVLETVGKTGAFPVFKGSRTRISDDPHFAPVDSPAARNIIETVKKLEAAKSSETAKKLESEKSSETAKNLDEPLYILALGAITNVVSAVMLDPSIAERVCVIWLGGHCLDREALDEFNLVQDYAAGQLLLNLDVPYIMLPAFDHGTCALLTDAIEMKERIKGDKPGGEFFRETLPRELSGDAYNDEWKKILWDVAAPAVLCVPQAYEFSVIPAPVFADGNRYAFDQTRRRIVYMDSLDRDIVLGDVFSRLSELCGG